MYWCIYADYHSALIADPIVASWRARKTAAIERARSLPELPDDYIPPDQLIPYLPA